MKNMFYLTILLSQVFIAISHSGPMESHTNYNVILVHGAGGQKYGLDCNNSNYDEAWKSLKPNENPKDTVQEHYLDLIGGYGSYSFGLKDFKSCAADMDKDDDGLRHWLTESIFDNDKSVIYLNRPFTNPANSPANNAKELGSRTWVGDGNCATRRSKIEEAQEVVAKGRAKLKELRKDVAKRDSLPPSRNILIAHSMGGVASREYVQGNFYNGDVDKVITLDSPHEGTGALNMLLSLDNKGWKNTDIFNINASKLLSLTIDLILTKMSSDNSSAAAALYGVVSSLGSWDASASSNLLIELLGYHYAQNDPLTPYIDPTRSGGINDLKDLEYRNDLPMMRLLYGTNSMKMI